ncbi:MAG TPA: hypothetical protein VHC47_14240 [Mucilaginibacter sp.]|nr:hypothetical protein [Mucilaginibacter sp.]
MKKIVNITALAVICAMLATGCAARNHARPKLPPPPPGAPPHPSR